MSPGDSRTDCAASPVNDQGMRPRSLRLTTLSPPMTIWSSRSMSSSFAALTSLLVMVTSSGLGVGSPEGWLWAMMIWATASMTAGLNTSAVRTWHELTLPW